MSLIKELVKINHKCRDGHFYLQSYGMWVVLVRWDEEIHAVIGDEWIWKGRGSDDVMQRNRKRRKRRLSEERCPFTTTMPLRKQYKRLHWYSHYFHFLASCPSQWPQTFCPDFKWSILSAINTFAFRHHFCFVHMQWSQDSQIIDWDKITNCSAVSIFKKKL